MGAGKKIGIGIGIVVLVIIIAVGASAIGGGLLLGDCVYVFEGNYNYYEDYTEAECDAYCDDVRYGSCYFEPY